MKRTRNFLPAFVIAALTVGSAQTTELAPVVSKPISRTIELPGEFQPFQSVSIHAKVRGYVDRVLVDRGSVVKQGQPLAELSAPEMKAHLRLVVALPEEDIGAIVRGARVEFHGPAYPERAYMGTVSRI